MQKRNRTNYDFPKLSAPAQRALANAGYLNLKHLTTVTEVELAKLHGMGPNALGKLKQALAERGLSLRVTGSNS